MEQIQHIPEFYHLPIMDADEMIELAELLTEDLFDGKSYIREVTKNVMIANGNISRAILHDINRTCKDELRYDLSDDEIKAYKAGMIEGYYLLVGCVTYMQFRRSNHTDLNTFILESPEMIMPVKDDAELKRVQTVRNDEAFLDTALNIQLQNFQSSELSIRHAERYLSKSRNFEALVELHQSIHTMHENDMVNEALSEGLFHGFCNAVEMYIQSYEEKSISVMEKSFI